MIEILDGNAPFLIGSTADTGDFFDTCCFNTGTLFEAINVSALFFCRDFCGGFCGVFCGGF